MSLSQKGVALGRGACRLRTEGGCIERAHQSVGSPGGVWAKELSGVEGAGCCGRRRGQQLGGRAGHGVQRRGMWVRHTRHRVRRLKAVANMVRSATTFTSPRNVNCWGPSWFFKMPTSGSISGSRRRYACCASRVAVQSRCRRRAAFHSRTKVRVRQREVPCVSVHVKDIGSGVCAQDLDDVYTVRVQIHGPEVPFTRLTDVADRVQDDDLVSLVVAGQHQGVTAGVSSSTMSLAAVKVKVFSVSVVAKVALVGTPE